MKRIVLLPIITLYFISISGITLNSFYCCNELQSVSVFQNNTQKDGCKDQQKLPGCCKNKVQYFKVTDNHYASNIININNTHFENILPFLPVLGYKISYQKILAIVNSHGPPQGLLVPVYILHCSYLI